MTTSIFNVNRPVVRRYLNYLRKRNAVWSARLDGRTPDYEGDHVLAHNRFTNIWRETDRFSVEEIRRLRRLKSLRQQVRLILVSRHSLVWPTIDMLLAGCTQAELKARWRWCQTQGGEGSFVSRAMMFYTKRGRTRDLQLLIHRDEVERYLDEVVSAIRQASPLDVLEWLPRRFDCLGSFRAYEMVTSFTYLPQVRWTEDDLAHVGPGSIGGLRYVTGRHVTESTAVDTMHELVDHVRDAVDDIPGWRWIPKHLQGSVNHKFPKKFTVRTLEDSMCEFRKYENIRTGHRKPRRRYHPMEEAA